MKELFETPDMEVVVFTSEDVMATSGDGDIWIQPDPSENEGPFVPVE